MSVTLERGLELEDRKVPLDRKAPTADHLRAMITAQAQEIRRNDLVAAYDTRVTGVRLTPSGAVTVANAQFR